MKIEVKQEYYLLPHGGHFYNFYNALLIAINRATGDAWDSEPSLLWFTRRKDNFKIRIPKLVRDMRRFGENVKSYSFDLEIPEP